MVEDHDPYEGREQSRVKHDVLRQYLESFAHIIGFNWRLITYIDGFSGPWNARSDDLSDTSFSIALTELRRARDTHATHGKRLNIRGVFVEKEKNAYERLKAFVAKSAEDAEIRTIRGEFEGAIDEIVTFIRSNPGTFSFTLIDPTGSTGFSMNNIAPLLQIRPGEVLITFMLEFIRRYIEQKELRKAFEDLFGTEDLDDFLQDLKDLEGVDRDDRITEMYCMCLSKYCGFPYVLRAAVLHPDMDRSYFQLIYGTRHIKGVEVFKNAEAKAMNSQEKQRAKVEERTKSKGGQKSFLSSDDMPESRYYIQLRDRYRSQARARMISYIKNKGRVEYDSLWLLGLSFPMVWEKDIRGWLKEWRDTRALVWHGLTSRGRELIRGKGHSVSLINDILS